MGIDFLTVCPGIMVWPGIAGLTIVWPGMLDLIMVCPGIAKAVMEAVLIRRTKSAV